MTWEVFGVINAQNNEEEDYLVQSIKVKGDFKIDLVNNEFPNDRIQVTQKLLKSRQISVNNIPDETITPIEDNKNELEFDKLYKAFFVTSDTQEDYKSFHRFVRRNTLNTCLNPKDLSKFKRLQKFRSNYKSIFRDDFRTGMFPSLVAPRDNSSHSWMSFREHKKFCSYETHITLVGHEFESESSLSDYSYSSQSSSEEEQRFDQYNENDLEESDNKDAKDGPGVSPNLEVYDEFMKRDSKVKRKVYIRKQSRMYFEDEATKEIVNDDDEDGGMELNGDYLLNKALLKDHDVQILRTNEMQHVLTE